MTNKQLLDAAQKCGCLINDEKNINDWMGCLYNFSVEMMKIERQQCVDVVMGLLDEKTGEDPEYYRGIVVAAAHILTKENQ